MKFDQLIEYNMKNTSPGPFSEKIKIEHIFGSKSKAL